MAATTTPLHWMLGAASGFAVYHLMQNKGSRHTLVRAASGSAVPPLSLPTSTNVSPPSPTAEPLRTIYHDELLTSIILL